MAQIEELKSLEESLNFVKNGVVNMWFLPQNGLVNFFSDESNLTNFSFCKNTYVS